MMSIMFISFAILTFGMCLFFQTQHAEIATWPETDCKITYSSVNSWTKRDVGENHTTTMHEPEVKYSYNVKGKNYTGKNIQPGYKASSDKNWAQSICNKYPAGGKFSCFYNPDSPVDVYLEKKPVIGLTIFWGLGIVFLALGIGIGKMGKSSLTGNMKHNDFFKNAQEFHKQQMDKFDKEDFED